MATKRKITTSVSVACKESTVASLLEAQSFVSAPNDAVVAINFTGPTGPTYDEEGNPLEYDQYSFTFTWSQEK